MPEASTDNMSQVMKTLNDAAYAAARLSRIHNDPRAKDLKRMALESDKLVDNPSGKYPK